MRLFVHCRWHWWWCVIGLGHRSIDLSSEKVPPLSSTILAAQETLKSVFGYDAFREGQEQAISAILDGRDVLTIMPTGAGKSLCFQVPALMLPGLTIVVSPLIALMQNQVEALRLLGVAAGAINSSRSRDENVAIWRKVAAGEIRILYMAPERLMTERMLDAVAKIGPALFAIDEAHCISQWGPAFRPEYEQLSELKGRFPTTPIIALTATADQLTRDHIAEKLFDGHAERVLTGFDRPNLELRVSMKDSPKSQLKDFVSHRQGDSGIVYCLSRKKTDDIAAFLVQEGHTALPYHAGMPSEDRARHLDRFMLEDGVIMVATIAFGMGIDKPDIRYVFHMDLPATPEAYYQEIGRAGRDGNPATVHMLYGLDDIRMRRMFIEEEDSDDDRKRREHQRLNALLAYCEAPECRRQTLLAYFGEEIAPCGACDTCLQPVETVDGNFVSKAALAAIEATGERFGAGHLIDVLRGSKNEKIGRFGHERLDCYGVGADVDASTWRTILRQMVARGFLDIDISNYGALQQTAKAADLLRGDEDFRYRPEPKKKSRSRRQSRAAIADLAPEDEDLFARLRALRLDLAQERGVPAYAIFTDKTLVDMASRRPQTMPEFGEIFGVGKAKQEKFAALFLSVLAS
ncbi:MAG: DNA helicase RecQ [Alphaproteobacteria bacterium]|nr:MAG: DNA helicase RecQ [Alphaproteobacteria bacterium]